MNFIMKDYIPLKEQPWCYLRFVTDSELILDFDEYSRNVDWTIL